MARAQLVEEIKARSRSLLGQSIILLFFIVCCFQINSQTAYGANKDQANRTIAFTKTRYAMDELDNELATMATKVKSLLTQKKFADLDKLAVSLRSNKKTYANGVAKIDPFYAGFYKPNNTSQSKLSDQEYKTLISQLTAWTKANPKSFTAYTALANTVWKYAWLARGSGYADSVSDEGWSSFQGRNQKALQYIKQAQKLGDCPRAWYVRLHLANDMSVGRTEYDAIYKQAIASHPEYMFNYFSRATYLQPRWHGEDGEWENFALQVASSIKDPEEANIAYARIVAWVEGTHWYRRSNFLHKFPKISWKNVRAGYAELMKRYPGSFATRSEFCKLACLAGEKELAKYLFVQLAGQVDKSVWRKESLFVQWRNWAFS